MMNKKIDLPERAQLTTHANETKRKFISVNGKSIRLVFACKFGYNRVFGGANYSERQRRT